MNDPILLVEALTRLLSGDALQGRDSQQNTWQDYRISEDGFTLVCKGEPQPLDILLELEWRILGKTPDQWVLEAKALLEMGASSVDAETLKGVLAKISELENDK